ncbi:MAG: cytochrome b [Parvibaculum sp.]|uniref:cytochrome b n=1 Tax=Parvibaculum sp. TaxID=2024848 RepID=UPI0025EBA90E|nr:cytochrome b [Parvibaculum sp.]MCE9648661.1 cytochrome b [Parvibaculum sp.]
MQLRNTALRFGLVAVTLHWLIAALFLAMIAIGLTMTNLALADPRTFPLYQLHKSLGVTIFVLILIRLAWRMTGQVPPLPATLKPWERLAAHATHYGLYAALLAMPLTGWITVSASPYGIPTVLYNTVRLPHLGFVVASPHKAAIEAAASWTHWGLAWTATALVALHIAAALKHRFILKDDVLARMLPSRAHFTKR